MLEAGDAAQRRGLAAAGRAEQDDELAVREGERDAVDGGDVAEGHPQVVEPDLRHPQTCRDARVRRRTKIIDSPMTMIRRITAKAEALPV